MFFMLKLRETHMSWGCLITVEIRLLTEKRVQPRWEFSLWSSTYLNTKKRETIQFWVSHQVILKSNLSLPFSYEIESFFWVYVFKSQDDLGAQDISHLQFYFNYLPLPITWILVFPCVVTIRSLLLHLYVEIKWSYQLLEI